MVDLDLTPALSQEEAKNMEQKKSEIQFKPITHGLGFHPFSDGLPYAPVVKSSPPMGSGAVAAGPPRIMAPIVRPKLPYPGISQKKEALISESPPPVLAVPSFGLGYLFKRVLAYLLDSTANTMLCILTLGSVYFHQDLDPELLMNPGLVFLISLFLFVFNWALITAQEVAFGTSFGKRTFGLVLKGGSGALFWRSVFFLMSVGFFGMGLLWALFKKNKRCWHDVAVDLQPIELAQL